MPSKVIIIVIEFMFLGINIFSALLRAHFESESGPKHIYAREHKLYCDIRRVLSCLMPLIPLFLSLVIAVLIVIFFSCLSVCLLAVFQLYY